MRYGARVVLAAVVVMATGWTAIAAPGGPGEGRAVALLVPAHRSYTFEMEGQPHVFRAIVAGERRILASLGEGDVATAWRYDEGRPWRLSAWAPVPHVSKALEEMKPSDAAPSWDPPSLYLALDQLISSIEAQADAVPARRYVLVVSDGKDVGLGDRAALAKTIDAIVAKAKVHRVRVVVLGLTLDLDEPLGPLAELAKRTGGSYTRTEAVDSDRAIADAVAAWGIAAVK